MPATAPALRIAHVSKSYGPVPALVDVSVSAESGECIALVGESGAGKSTLLRCINRLEDVDGGHIHIDEVDVARQDPVELRRAIGYVPQEGGLMPHWRVGRNAALVPWLRKASGAQASADEALRLVGLEPSSIGARWPHELSGGQRQRVAVARALAGSQSLLLLDEAFGALDALTRSELHELMWRIRRERPLTTVLVTHDLREALLLANRVAVLRAGRLEQMAEPETLRRAPATPYVAALLERAGIGS